MTEEAQTTETTENKPSELETLKARADMMGIKYHHKSGADTIRKLINERLGESEDSQSEKDENGLPKNVKLMTHAEFKAERKARAKKLANALVRVRVSCMNPTKREWEGEIISVGSAKIGTFKKYIPFNVEWHIPYIIYQAMKERKCSIFHTVKDHLGQKVRKAKLINEFNIEVLPPLTQKELKDLAQRQAMAAGGEN